MTSCPRFTCPREACPCKAEVIKMRALLKRIGYPARGTRDDDMTIYDAAELVQKEFTLEQLELTP